MSNYEEWRQFAASWGLVYFALIFFIGVAWVMWPSRRKFYEDAAQMPLRED